MTTNDTSNLPDPASAPELFQDLLKRRVAAYTIDILILSIIASVVVVAGMITGILTFGVGLVAIPVAIPVSIVGYYALTLGSASRATVGMKMMDIVLTPTGRAPLDGWRAFAHPLLFWLTCWILPPFSFLFALFTPRRQMIHDLIIGTLMVRRSPMEDHWAEQGAY